MDELKLTQRLLDVLNDWDLSCSEEPELKLEIARQQAKVVKLLATPAVSESVCKHEWIMTADSFDQTCYCKKCGKSS